MTAPAAIIRVVAVAEVVKVIRVRRPAPEKCPDCEAPAPDHLIICARPARLSAARKAAS